MSVTDASFPIINWSKAMPSLRQLMYFACVAEYGSIGQAAEVLHVSRRRCRGRSRRSKCTSARRCSSAVRPG
ncbi:LysR family transcriptional regulator [Pseudomonas aeruginosa]|nr:LysR family transcriptional regulator [Pseudomonas aeruginosa]